MENLWILTEERPKVSVLLKIIELYCDDFGDSIEENTTPTITPIVKDGFFSFSYCLVGIKLKNISNIFILTVSGESSFFDFLIVKQVEKPEGNYCGPNVLMAIEETKTSDDESRNTGVYQRASKFAFIDIFFKNIKKYMLYNDELIVRQNKKPSATSVFGTNMLLTQDVKIVGKDISSWFSSFNSINDLIKLKSQMRLPPAGNVPITITMNVNVIVVTGRLEKPIGSGNIAHDPNIGAISCISKTIRDLGWKNGILLRNHGVSQSYINSLKTGNKFLSICKLLSIEMEGISIPDFELPTDYWHYEKSSEKIASIFLHIVAENFGLKAIYQNHAGCERGYFKTQNNPFVVLPKKDSQGELLFIPDLILLSEATKEILIIEGKQLKTLANGISELNNYGSITNEFIIKNYPKHTISKWLTIFGGNLSNIPHPSVLLYISEDGNIVINENAPLVIRNAFTGLV
jgi:hypothetical protein